jgi:cyanophycinase
LKDKNCGHLLIIGGAEDKHGDCLILRRLVALAGGAAARIAVVTAASEDPVAEGERYRAVFGRLGAAEVRVIDAPDRLTANDPALSERLKGTSAVFFTGGDQLRITSCVGGTRLDRAVRALYERGTIIAGTSAGASVMSDTMIVAGDSDDAPKKCTTKMAPGMGFLREVVIDQHFAQRGRVGRLLSALAQNPRVHGVGIDEDTAILVGRDGTFVVIGSQTVTVLDGVGIAHTNASESSPDDLLALSGVTMHILPAGYGYDLNRREVRPPVDDSGTGAARVTGDGREGGGRTWN